MFTLRYLARAHIPTRPRLSVRPRLTERQNQVLEFIRAYLREHRKPPTYQEIGDALAIRSTNGVRKQLLALEDKGYLRREPRAARGLFLLDEEPDAFALDAGPPTLPVVSRTRSDAPEALRSRPAGSLAVDPRLLGHADPDRCLLARAGDDGMNGDGIRKGDLLIIEERPRAEVPNGVVAALVGEQLLARRYDWANGRVHLRPADRTYAEETFPPDDPGCHVIGPVLGLIRRFQ